MKSIPIPSDFDPHHYFGDGEDDDDGIEKEEKIQTKEATNTPIQHQHQKPNLSYKEKQQLLFRIYDEGEIPVELLTKEGDC